MAGIERIRQTIIDPVARAADAGQIDAPAPAPIGDQVAIAMRGLGVTSRGGATRTAVAEQADHALAAIRPA